ncbi:MAG: hypothetical protein H6505_02895 [Calditrichaeota bacterium]|nr:hypothetical protein [Calditrichota bacterium]
MDQTLTNPSDLKPEDLIWWYQNRALLSAEARGMVEKEIDRRGIARESIPEPVATAPARPMPMTWFNVWRWGVLPLIALNAVTDLLAGLGGFTDTERLFSAGTIIAVVILMVLLEKRHLYGWWLNWVFIFAIALSGLFPNIVDENDQPLEMDFATSATIRAFWALVFLVGWLWPNWVYFKKRRHIFTEPEQAEPETMNDER